MSGFYLMHRGWHDSPIFGREAYSRRDAWVWMIEQAVYTEHNIDIAGKTVTLQRGQFSSSLRYMAKAWGWDEAKVRRFLSRARNEKMIDASTDAGQTIITICNYDKYQSLEKSTDAASDAAATQQRRGSDANNNKGNQGNEISSEANASSDTPAPRRKSKKDDEEPFVLPSDIPADAWAGFEEMRNRLRKPMTDRARRGIVKRLYALAEDGYPPGDVLDQSTMKSWTGVYDIKDGRNGNNRNGGNYSSGKVNPFDAVCREVAESSPDRGQPDDDGGMSLIGRMGS